MFVRERERQAMVSKVMVDFIITAAATNYNVLILNTERRKLNAILLCLIVHSE